MSFQTEKHIYFQCFPHVITWISHGNCSKTKFFPMCIQCVSHVYRNNLLNQIWHYMMQLGLSKVFGCPQLWIV